MKIFYKYCKISLNTLNFIYYFMNQVKAPFLLKFSIFLISFLLLVNSLVFQDYFTQVNLLSLLLTTISFFIFFFTLKWKTWAVKIAMILPFIIILLFSFFLNLIIVIQIFIKENINSESNLEIMILSWWIFVISYIILLILYLYRLKNINKLNNKHFTELKQEKIYAIIFWILSIFLIIFKFSYYDIDEKIEVPPEWYFITKYEDKELNSEKNLYVLMKDFEKHKIPELEKYKYFKEKMFACIYENICYWNIEDWQNSINSFRWIYRKEIQEEISKLETEKAELEYYINQGSSSYLGNKIKDIDYKMSSLKKQDIVKFDSNKLPKIEDKNEKLKIKLLLKKNLDIFLNWIDWAEFENMLKDFLKFKNTEYFKEDTSMEPFLSTWQYPSIVRELKYKIFYLLQNKQEKEAIEIIESIFDFSEKLINWDSLIIEFVVWLTVYNNWLEITEKILDNFYLWNDSKNKLKGILLKKIDIDEIARNVSKVEFKEEFSVLDSALNWEIIFPWVYKEDIYNMRKEYYYDIWNNRLSNSEKYTNKYLKKYNDGGFIWYKKSIFKKNFISRYFLEMVYLDFSIGENLETTLQKREGLLKKLD